MFECQFSPDEVARRISGRVGVSDADEDVARRLRAELVPWAGSHPVDTSGTPTGWVDVVCEAWVPLRVRRSTGRAHIWHRTEPARHRRSRQFAGRLGIYGFGASAHLTAQLALAEGAEVHVLTRDEPAQRLALELGAASAGPGYGRPPVPLDAAILFAPVGDLVPVALTALDRGGTLAVAGIHLSDIPVLDYQEHLFRERTPTSVTANTRRDGEELLRLAASTGMRASVTTYPFSAADAALDDLANGALVGAAVLLGCETA